ncbi:MAG: 3'(2'),5'-bisphosphate nucleotidase CysQ [Sorangium cellulosum]|nr:MAG: 3'(2'),5'-bisphosphate nucleotidase CysQ [Sorangium cellulosum]
MVLAVYRREFDVELKDGNEPVTQADRRANALLVDRFCKAFPNDGIVAEESLPSNTTQLKATVSKERVWFIDPLDGTKELIARNGEFSVMIGLALAGRPVLGVVAMPVSGEVAAGVVGQGAWLLASSGQRSELRVSGQTRLDACTVIISRSHASERLKSKLDAIGPAHRLQCGSVGVKVVRIAQQKADVYINVGGAKLWDGCAPEAIMAAAGGKVTDGNGNTIDYATTILGLNQGFVATNGLLHDATIAATREHR